MGRYYSPVINPPAEKISIDPAAVMRMLGLPENYADPYIDNLIAHYIKLALSLCSPAGYYLLCGDPRFSGGRELLLEGERFLTDRIITGSLKGSSHMVLFICTAGAEVSALAGELMQNGDSLDGLIVDLVGSEIAEGMAGYLNGVIAGDMAARGWQITNRYSPGYCGWPVADQHKLFRLLPGKAVGVDLNESALMSPVKSVSGLIGAGKDVRFRPYNCSRCAAEACIYREKDRPA